MATELQQRISGSNRPATRRREDWLSDSLLSGFVATFAMSLALAGAYGLANVLGNQSGSSITKWLYNLNHNGITERAGESVVLAIGLNLILGIVFAVIYGAIEPSLPGRAGWQRGMIFASFLWALSVVAFFPIMDGGIFGRALDAGPLPLIGNLVLHMVYGAALGSLFAVDLDAWLDGSDADHFAALDLQRDTMLGIIGGIVIGVIGGALLNSQFDDLMSNGMTLLVSALVGGGIGALIGSFTSEDHGNHVPR